VYLKYFGLTERPFSIAPDPNYLYMSARHKEAMAHLTYGLSQGGCFIVLSGEVGTGKTTLCRNLLSDLPKNVDVALILNANINELELLQTVCDELKIAYRNRDSQKQLLDRINKHLLATFSANRHTVLIIDEAQLLSRDVLEKIRLLTNLETTKSKLLQIILIGQPELNDLLGRNDLRQLAQRVTARYHLGALERSEVDDYINFRLGVAGCKQPIFSRQALNKLHSLTGGIPRKMNVLADHALLSAYSKTQSMVDSGCVKKAASDVFIQSDKPSSDHLERYKWWGLAAAVLLLNLGLSWFFWGGEPIDAIARSPVTLVSEGVPAGVENANSARTNERLGSKRANTEPVIEPKSGQQLAGNVKTPSDDSKFAMIARPEGVEPGSVVISEEYLDEPQPASAAVARVSDFVPAADPEPAPIELKYDPDSDFGAVLDTSADITGRIAAFRNLGQAWDATLPDKLLKPACRELNRKGVECSSATSWDQVLRFNRPSILVVEQRGRLHRVIIFKIESEQAQVLVGENVHTVSLKELEARWKRKAVTLWRPGDAGNTVLRRGESFDILPVVRKHMNQALAVASLPGLNDLDSTKFDADIMQKTRALQSRYGLVADGKVGKETYLLMNELTAPDSTPVLRQRIP